MYQFILAALAAGIAGASSGAQQARPIAEAYLAAYEAQDFDTLASLYAPDAIFIDPTSFAVEQTLPIEWQTPETIIAGLQSWNVAAMDYELDRSFEASGRVVFDGAVTVVYAMQGDEQRAWRFPIVTIVTVADGHVTEHRDYTDYAGMTRIALPVAHDRQN